MSVTPFANVRVLDFTHYLAGPFGTFQLALQGADVIKVEPRGGDASRTSPLFQEWAARGMGPFWMAINAGKRSITLDVTKPDGAAIVERLVRDVDVVCENFRPGVLERLGIGWTQLSKINPRLIYCAISGFGSTGPESGTPSFDGKIQAMSGLMSLTGEAETGPMRAGFAVADATSGLMSAFAVAAALYQRTQTGKGQFVDVSMVESLMSLFSGLVAEHTVTGHKHDQFGNGSVSRKPTAHRFRCGDGYVVLAVLTDRQFESLLTTLGRADALDDPRFADWPARTENHAVLRDVIETAMEGGDPREWERRLSAANVPCASIYSIDEIVAHPQIAHRGLLEDVETPYGAVKLMGPAFHLAHGQGGIRGRVAMAGEHTDDILAAAGYDAEAIADLRARQVI
jgi:crotonobetainyl-CoA:carnitine CoA-transferase CaiB-like acyl-CoA transferase